MNITFKKTNEFIKWMNDIKGSRAYTKIFARLRQAESGNFCDHASVGSGVYEMRLHYGPGYRIYYFRRRNVVYYLLLGGDKSTQKQDIVRAIKMKHFIEEGNDE